MYSDSRRTESENILNSFPYTIEKEYKIFHQRVENNIHTGNASYTYYFSPFEGCDCGIDGDH